jgi:hypothetical protein
MKSIMKLRASTFGTYLCAGSVVLALLIVLVSTSLVAQAKNYHILYTFTGGADGGPWSWGLIRDARGILYGTTMAGGLTALERCSR